MVIFGKYYKCKVCGFTTQHNPTSCPICSEKQFEDFITGPSLKLKSCDCGYMDYVSVNRRRCSKCGRDTIRPVSSINQYMNYMKRRYSRLVDSGVIKVRRDNMIDELMELIVDSNPPPDKDPVIESMSIEEKEKYMFEQLMKKPYTYDDLDCSLEDNIKKIEDDIKNIDEDNFVSEDNPDEKLKELVKEIDKTLKEPIPKLTKPKRPRGRPRKNG